MSANLFEQFRTNLQVANSDAISSSYRAITKRLNKDFWGIDSEEQHCLQVGSYGRHTAIRDVSDLDMVFVLPQSVYDRVSKVNGNGPSQLLQEVRKSLKERYPTSDIRAAQQVVQVHYEKYRVEVLPAFKQADGRYRYGDANDGGSWDNYCNPRAEIDALNTQNNTSNRNLKRVCKMLRAWKNKHGAPMSGMLIDTLVNKFFQEDTSYNNKSYSSYPALARDVFAFLGNLDEQDYWLAPGSRSRVQTKGKFQRKAKKAAAKCQDALDAEKDAKKVKLWKEVFGRRFPSLQTESVAKAFVEARHHAKTEQFIEDLYPVDIQYNLDIECIVAYAGNEETRYRFMESVFSWLKLGRSLTFRIVSCNVPEPYEVFWKVRNVGAVAERRNMIRGHITRDTGRRQSVETTSFGGEHFVECYVIKDGICVARDLIEVPIELA